METVSWTAASIGVREVCNGIMFLAALGMLAVFGHYILKVRNRRRDWYSSTEVKAALAIMVLIAGHAIRSGGSWMEFMWVDLGWDPHIWIDTFIVFIAATAVTLAGKVLMILIFSPAKYRGKVIAAVLGLSMAIPLTLYWITS